MSKNTYKYQLQKNFLETPVGNIEKGLSLNDTKELYNMLVSSLKDVDKNHFNVIKDKQNEILKIHISKVKFIFIKE